ncbi:hypothetical protein CEN46_25760, partial [Fischerella thermalis CCMEE 5318]
EENSGPHPPKGGGSAVDGFPGIKHLALGIRGCFCEVFKHNLVSEYSESDTTGLSSDSNSATPKITWNVHQLTQAEFALKPQAVKVQAIVPKLQHLYDS